MTGKHRQPKSWRELARDPTLTLSAGLVNGLFRHGATAGLAFAGHEIHGAEGAAVGLVIGMTGDMAGLSVKRAIHAVRDRRARSAAASVETGKRPATVDGPSPVVRRAAMGDVLKAATDRWPLPDALGLAAPVAESVRDGVGEVIERVNEKAAQPPGSHAKLRNMQRTLSGGTERMATRSTTGDANRQHGDDGKVAPLTERVRRAAAPVLGRLRPGDDGATRPAPRRERAREHQGPTLER